MDSSKRPDRRGVNGSKTRLRYVGFRLGAVGLALLPFLLAELLLRIFVPAPTTDLEDPYVSFSTQSLFVLSEDGSRYETDEKRLTFFRKQSFPAQKADGTVRIFCLGGSTVQGRPYSVQTAFPMWLQINLQAVDQN